MEQSLTTISDVVNAIKTTLEFEYSDLLLVGEVSNLSLSSAGHYYFSLSDSKASLSCALFKMDALRNPFIRRIKNGDKVIVRGPISVYSKRGTFQVIVKKITPHGKGDLKAQFEVLKEKLSMEGLFDISLKKTVPIMPKKIAVVTALRGAALQDFLNVLKRRCLWFDIVIVPSIVQGDQCSASVIKAIEKIEKLNEAEVIVLTRGGGSMEDLWGFNDEALVRKVAGCTIPTISAIGHQVDYTLTDYASDLRCETPSTAAEFLSQEQTRLNQRMKISLQKMSLLFHNFKDHLQKRLNRVNPIRLSGLLQSRITQNSKKLETLNLFKRESLLKVKEHEFFLDELVTKLERLTKNSLSLYKQKLSLYEKSLFNLNPKQVLARGYTYVSHKDNILDNLNKFKNVSSQEKIKITFHDGEDFIRKEQ